MLFRRDAFFLRNREPILRKCRVVEKDASIDPPFNDMTTRCRHPLHVYLLLGLFWVAATTAVAQDHSV